MMKSRNMHALISKKKQLGVTMIEYALIAALVAIAAIVALGLLGDEISAKFTSVTTAIHSAN